jgi:divalent metal cation (Fe/Co/Zn/Cd) transporter
VSIPAGGVLGHGSTAWQRAARRASLLSWASLAYMSAEGALAITAAVLAGSVALLGLGVDSVIEGAGSVIIVWRFAGGRALSETAEGRAQKAIAVSFFLLAPYIVYEAIGKLARAEHASTSWLGIGLAAASLIIMPFLGSAICINAALQPESRRTVGWTS